MNVYAHPSDQIVEHLLAEIEQGLVKIPRFQRDFVWTVEKSAALVDSILKGYPIGSIIFWRTSDTLRQVRSLGRIKFAQAAEGEKVNYVLDGQQRLTSLFAALRGETVTTNDGRTFDFSALRVDLNSEDPDAPICRVDTPDRKGAICIPLTRLFKGGSSVFKDFPESTHEKIDALRSALTSYRIPNVRLSNASIAVATEVFSRLNTGGQTLSVFEIMVAKTYDPESEFDLVDKFDELKDQLEEAGYETIDTTDVLQLIALILEGDCRKSTILNIKRSDFIATWPKAVAAIGDAVDYIRSAYRIPVSKLLPYTSILVPFALFFHHQPSKKPSKTQRDLLRDFFWRVGWSERYSSATESKLAQDYRSMKSILKEKRPRYDWSAEVTVDDIKDAWFSAGAAFSKTILCVLANARPEKFDSGDPVNLRNDWMNRADSVNFHHVFPRAYLRNKGCEDWEANRILNISLVDDFLNKRVIRARAPSSYMTEFHEKNENFSETMKTHLISGDDDAPIWSDDYDQFIEDRAKAVVKKVRGWLVKDETD